MRQKTDFRQKAVQFMQGRYGVDQFSNFLVWAGVLLSLITLLVRQPVLMFTSWVLIIYAYVRIFSKQINKRYAQNQKFLDITFPIGNVFAKIRYRIKYGKNSEKPYHIYRCRKCGQKIRIPKGKGKIMVTCPKCKYQFKKKS